MACLIGKPCPQASVSLRQTLRFCFSLRLGLHCCRSVSIGAQCHPHPYPCNSQKFPNTPRIALNLAFHRPCWAEVECMVCAVLRIPGLNFSAWTVNSWKAALWPETAELLSDSSIQVVEDCWPLHPQGDAARTMGFERVSIIWKLLAQIF